METVTRFREGGGVDENGDPIEVDTPPAELIPLVIAPGATNEMDALGRDGESVEYTLFFAHGTDVLDGDELEVRGRRLRARVRVWRPQKDPSFGGVEVVAVSRTG